MRLVVFGVSNLLGDILDCALELGLEPALVVMNVPEAVRARTKSAAERLRWLPRPPRIIGLEAFSPQPGECYALGTTARGRDVLVDDLASRFGITCRTLVHPAAWVSPRATLAAGVFVGAGAVIGSGAQLGAHVFVNRRVTIGHDVEIGPYATLGPGCNVGGHTRIGAGAAVGIGASVIEELEIGAAARIAAGAVVIEDVPPDALVAGVPAAVKKKP